MRILFLAHRIPFPPDKGDKIRSYHVLSYLARKHEVHLGCLVDDRNDLQAVERLREQLPGVIYQELRPLKKRLSMLKALMSGMPLTVNYFQSNDLRKQLRELLEQKNFDAVHVYSSSMAEYVRDMDVPIRIIDFCDLDSEKFRQYAELTRGPLSWLYRLESRRLAAYEQRLVPHFHHILFISPEERRLFGVNGFSDKLKLMSNGVNLDEYQSHELPATSETAPAGKPYLLFIGLMNYLPNIDAARWFTREVFPILKTILPELQFYIIGNHPVRAVKRLHDPAGGVFVTGYLKDLRPYIRNAEVFVAPMRIARGMQTKILEAMAYGAPVVASSAAARGIGARHEKELLVADTASDCVRSVLALLLNEKLRERLRKRAYNFLKQNFNWEQNLRILDSLLEECGDHGGSHLNQSSIMAESKQVAQFI